eukprot:gnl/TRDRNA2_/TRDRNA2_180213_c0_seq1.p2 gnl/TRDRNA2_/TRDRNA2_180213_c0~~gnl/TRDRNA2_/TRDRNA2_180213_c0_seq1.p2  ORF type:complete len:146 (+),score=36.14 gnl/TRDRNA2_/TRDRNA2_180213_c0_seq1:79-516(+)
MVSHVCFAVLLLGLPAVSLADEWTAIKGVKTTFKTLKEGTGSAVVTPGDTVTVHATGTVISSGKKFWSTKDKGQQPFTYTAGGGVITGWDKGAMGMKKGETRLLQIPGNEAYGARGFPSWGIPADAELQFEIELLSFKGKKNSDL